MHKENKYKMRELMQELLRLQQIPNWRLFVDIDNPWDFRKDVIEVIRILTKWGFF